MQKTAVGRIAKFWPAADIQVFTESPLSLPPYAPNVRGKSVVGRKIWMSGFLPPRRIPQAIRHWERRMRARHPQVVERLAQFNLRSHANQRTAELTSFLESTREADLLVVCGMGGIADTFEQYALDLLDTIALVKENGKSIVAMFGQAFGPISDQSVVARRAREVLPLVDFMALREARAGIPLLERLNVDLSRVKVTGDDALEIAAQSRSSELGSGLGLNIRVACYSNITFKHATQLRETILPFARARGMSLMPLPSSLYVDEADSKSIAALTEGYEHISFAKVTDPASLTAQVQRCRIAIVGSYHAGVYALAQGVSIVGLYNSDYYRDKFLGLKALFGVGVFPVDLSVPEWKTNLIKQANGAWDAAPSCRTQLIEAVDKQIESGWTAYNELRDLVNAHLARLDQSDVPL